MDRAYEAYKRENIGRVGRGAKTSFQTAMACRVSTRLVSMSITRDAEVKTEVEQLENSDALPMIVDAQAEKIEKVEAAYTEKYGGRLRAMRSLSSGSNGSAYGAGTRAGDRVNLGRALNRTSCKALA